MACLAVAAFTVNLLAGLITTGLLLVLIGYALEDQKAAVVLHRVTAPVSAYRSKRKQKRADKG